MYVYAVFRLVWILSHIFYNTSNMQDSHFFFLSACFFFFVSFAFRAVIRSSITQFLQPIGAMQLLHSPGQKACCVRRDSTDIEETHQFARRGKRGLAEDTTQQQDSYMLHFASTNRRNTARNIQNDLK